MSAWAGGFWGQITISGAAADAARRSTLEWALPGSEQITELWDATVSQHGARVEATHLTAGKHGSLTVGFIATTSVTGKAAPAHIALNGAGCRGAAR